ncbi:MAG: hypothetical protein EBZ24_10250, partial [Synechococcaceae bacterium WB9_4xB_025]|nr:hypothetical protein [Synechococcaceae bacterium WB9_4xB_025]
MNQRWRQIALWVLPVVVALVLAWQVIGTGGLQALRPGGPTEAPRNAAVARMSYGRFLGAGVIVFTAFSGALNAGLPVMFDREFGFLNRLLVAPLRSRSSIVLASVIYITALSLLQSLAIMGTAAVL